MIIYLNNNNILLEIVNDLHQLMNYTKDNLIIKTLGNIIIKMNNMINENMKNTELIRNDISKIYTQMKQLNNKFNKVKINDNKELQCKNGRYVGQVVNGLREGKGIYYVNNGDRYEGEWKNDLRDGKGIEYYHSGNRYEDEHRNGLREGKGIYYFNKEPYKGDRYEGDFKNGKIEGKGIYYYNNGIIYEGDFKNDNKEGKGIFYFNNGNRRMGDYYNDKPIGKHVLLTYNGEVQIENY